MFKPNKMNSLYYLWIWMFVIVSLSSCEPAVETLNSNGDTTDLAYDSVRAQLYGADEYGMKKYIIAFLKRGPNKNLSADSSQLLQMAHLENIKKMAQEGQLVLAGPFFGDQDLRGIYIFNVETIEEAQILTNTDPAIEAGVLEMDLMEWYGSAALMAVNEIHNSLTKREITGE